MTIHVSYLVCDLTGGPNLACHIVSVKNGRFRTTPRRHDSTTGSATNRRCHSSYFLPVGSVALFVCGGQRKDSASLVNLCLILGGRDADGYVVILQGGTRELCDCFEPRVIVGIALCRRVLKLSAGRSSPLSRERILMRP